MDRPNSKLIFCQCKPIEVLASSQRLKLFPKILISTQNHYHQFTIISLLFGSIEVGFVIELGFLCWILVFIGINQKKVQFYLYFNFKLLFIIFADYYQFLVHHLHLLEKNLKFALKLVDCCLMNFPSKESIIRHLNLNFHLFGIYSSQIFSFLNLHY